MENGNAINIYVDAENAAKTTNKLCNRGSPCVAGVIELLLLLHNIAAKMWCYQKKKKSVGTLKLTKNHLSLTLVNISLGKM